MRFVRGHLPADAMAADDGVMATEFIARFRWAPGSIAMWDNRQTWHFAVNDYQGQRRVMHRILLAGSKPVPAA